MPKALSRFCRDWPRWNGACSRSNEFSEGGQRIPGNNYKKDVLCQSGKLPHIFHYKLNYTTGNRGASFDKMGRWQHASTELKLGMLEIELDSQLNDAVRLSYGNDCR